MKITFLGTGTSQGVPVIGCDCAVCRSTDRRDNRLRVSVLIETGGKKLVIDAGPDFRYQMLRAGVKNLDAILFTHEHKDHIAGLDDVRAFNYINKSDFNVYASRRVNAALRREFYYAFEDVKYPGVPLINLHEISNHPFESEGIAVQPVEVMHNLLPVLGFRIGDFTYITDAKTVSDEEMAKIKGSKILVINALQKEYHISHFTFDEALAFAQRSGVPEIYFTHISHKLGKHAEISAELPAGIALAYDGLELTI